MYSLDRSYPPPRPPSVASFSSGRRCALCHRFQRNFYGIGPREVVGARIIGVVLLFCVAIAYFGFTLSQYLNTPMITRTTTLLRPIIHPDAVICVDYSTLNVTSMDDLEWDFGYVTMSNYSLPQARRSLPASDARRGYKPRDTWSNYTSDGYTSIGVGQRPYILTPGVNISLEYQTGLNYSSNFQCLLFPMSQK